MRCSRVVFGAEVRSGEEESGAEIRAAAAGGIAAPGIAAVSGIGLVGAAGGCGLAGGGITLGGTAGAGTCAVCPGIAMGPGFFSATGIDGGAGGAIGGCNSTRGATTIGGGIFTVGNRTAAGAACFTSEVVACSPGCLAGGTPAAILLCNSPTARCNFVSCFACSSASAFNCLRRLACFTNRAIVKKGEATTNSPTRTNKRMARGMGIPRTHRSVSSEGRTDGGGNLAFCSSSPRGSNHACTKPLGFLELAR